MSEPTPEQKTAALARYKGIIELLNHGLFFGHGAGQVHDAIGFLSAIVNAMDSIVNHAPPHIVPEEPAP